MLFGGLMRYFLKGFYRFLDGFHMQVLPLLVISSGARGSSACPAFLRPRPCSEHLERS